MIFELRAESLRALRENEFYGTIRAPEFASLC